MSSRIRARIFQLLLFFAALLLAGCGTSAPTTTQPAEQASTDKPVYGGILLNRFANADPPSYDLHKEATWNTYRPVGPSYDTLVRYDPTNPSEIIPSLAEKWSYSADGKALTLNLHKGVKFHNGDEFTSDDVKFTLERNKGDFTQGPAALTSSPRKDLFKSIDKIETPDPYTVVLRLKTPTASLLDTLANGFHVVYNKKWVESGHNPSKEVNGTGPFKFKEAISGVSVEVVKNESYWNAGLPYLDGVKTLVVPDDNTSIAALRTGQQMYMNLNLAQEEDIRKQIEGGALKDVLRLQSVGGPANAYWPLPPEELAKMPGYAADKAKERDAAKKLLADAGFPNGLTFTGMIRKDAQFSDRGIVIKDQLNKIGVTMNIQLEENAAAYDRGVKGDFEISHFGAQGFYINVTKKPFDDIRVRQALTMAIDRNDVAKVLTGPGAQLLGYASDTDPDTVYGVFFATGAGRNYMRYSNKKVDELIAKQSQSLDRVERRKIVWELEKILLTEVPTLTNGASRPTAWALNTKLRGLEPELAPQDLARLDTVWLAK